MKILVIVLHAYARHRLPEQPTATPFGARQEGQLMAEIVSTWMRGGTSKCWVFDRSQLEVADRSVDDVLLRVFGSPDPRQVDGVGGGTSTTSKAVILSRALADDVDVDYTFAQVVVDEARVDWASNCGNCSSVVGLYAVRRGWVPAESDVTVVRIRNTNTGQLIVLDVQTPGGVLDERGREWIPGVPFPGIGVRMWFVDPAGRTTGSLFPTGNATDALPGRDGPVDVTLVDAGAPVVIVRAETVGVSVGDSPAELDARPDLLALLDDLRREGAVRMGLAPDKASAARAVPKLAVVASPDSGGDADLVVRMLSMGRLHPALAITGSVALTMAARDPGSVIAHPSGPVTGEQVRMMTPAGLVTTWTGDYEGQVAVGVMRTTRRLAEATLILPDEEEQPASTVAVPGSAQNVDAAFDGGGHDREEVGTR
jgi:2-methylaconitate cis-trans-isomerase PrpF